jgi:hypothetical protein
MGGEISRTPLGSTPAATALPTTGAGNIATDGRSHQAEVNEVPSGTEVFEDRSARVEHQRGLHLTEASIKDARQQDCRLGTTSIDGLLSPYGC